MLELLSENLFGETERKEVRSLVLAQRHLSKFNRAVAGELSHILEKSSVSLKREERLSPGKRCYRESETHQTNSVCLRLFNLRGDFERSRI